MTDLGIPRWPATYRSCFTSGWGRDQLLLQSPFVLVYPTSTQGHTRPPSFSPAGSKPLALSASAPWTGPGAFCFSPSRSPAARALLPASRC